MTYFLFGYEDYYPAGGMDDLLLAFTAKSDFQAKTKADDFCAENDVPIMCRLYEIKGVTNRELDWTQAFAVRSTPQSNPAL
jgi:hypothetical protein